MQTYFDNSERLRAYGCLRINVCMPSKKSMLKSSVARLAGFPFGARARARMTAVGARVCASKIAQRSALFISVVVT